MAGRRGPATPKKVLTWQISIPYVRSGLGLGLRNRLGLGLRLRLGNGLGLGFGLRLGLGVRG